MTEAEATRLPHPTPGAIKLACHDAADQINAERRRMGLPDIGHEWLDVIARAVSIANEEHHRERA